MLKQWTVSLFAIYLTATTALGQGRVYRAVEMEALKDILRELNRPFRQEKNALVFNVQGRFDVSVFPFKAGKTLVLASNDFKAVSLARINQWNSDRVLSRAILTTLKDGTKASRLEADLDCTLGITAKTIDGFIVHYV